MVFSADQSNWVGERTPTSQVVAPRRRRLHNRDMVDELFTPAQVVRRYCEAWLAGDVATVLSLYHDDLRLEWFGQHRLAGTHRGQQASLDALLAVQAATDRTPTEIVEILDGSDSVVALVHERWTDPADASKVLNHLRALQFTVRDSMIDSCRVFETEQGAIDAWLTDV